MLYDLSQVAWTNEDIKVLGVTIAKDNIIEKNFSEIIVKTRNILNSWTNRNLSLIGKINIINTLISPLFIHKLLVLEDMTDAMYKTINNEIVNFLWNGKKPKIALKILHAPKKSWRDEACKFKN